MAACFVSCYWLSLPPSVVFFRKKGFYFSPSLGLSKEQIEMESLYTRLMDSLLLKKTLRVQGPYCFVKCPQKYQKGVF